MRVRSVCALLILAIAVFWRGHLWTWPGEGEGFAIFLLALGTTALAGGVYAMFGRATRDPGVTAAALALAILAAGGPLLLNVWIRGEGERYLWIIRQGYPCSTMGGGPGMLWVFAHSWLVALAAFAYATAGGRVVLRGALPGGLLGGGALLIAVAAAMFPAPIVFAAALGCLR